MLTRARCGDALADQGTNIMRRTIPRALVAAFLGVAITAGAAHALGGGGSSNSAATDDGDYTAAQSAIQDEDFPAAVSLLTKVVGKSPENADAQNLLGYSYRKLGDLDNAIVHYLAALEVDPKHKNAHEYIGEAYLDLGDLESAEIASQGARQDLHLRLRRLTASSSGPSRRTGRTSRAEPGPGPCGGWTRCGPAALAWPPCPNGS